MSQTYHTPLSACRSFLLLLALAAWLCPAPLRAVAAAKQSPVPAQSVTLQKLITEFNALEQDAKKGGRRDLWLGLEGKFAALRAKSAGESAAKAAYYHARAREELGLRSHLASDHRESVTRFAAVAAKHPQDALAPESLYRQAVILENRLQDHPAAVAVLERLLRDYPKATQAAGAKTLLTKAQAGSSGMRRDGEEKKAAPSSVFLKSISWEGKGQRAVISLELDGPAGYSYAFLPPDKANKRPARLYVDIVNSLPAKNLRSVLRPQDLVVTGIRTGSYSKGTRVTLECEGLRCYTVTTPENEPRTIRIEVSLKDDIAGAARAAAGKGGKSAGPSSSPRPESAESVMDHLGLTVKTIIIDAGHGRHDPGAMAGGITEKHFTLGMAKRVGGLLQKKGFTVLYTRTKDEFISLQDRPDIANRKKADLFISIHVNANNSANVRGLETYYLDAAKTQDAAVVAARENAISVKNISDLQVILTDLMLSSKLAESRQLARCAHDGILKKLRAARLASPDNGVRSAPFYVLMGARMPAILVEFGYATNTADAANLKSETYLQRQAEGLVDGILRYKQELASMAALPH